MQLVTEKIFIWSDGCAAQFRSRFVFCFSTEINAELVWNYNEKSHGKGPMDGIGGTVKNVIFQKFKSQFITIDTPFGFLRVYRYFQ